MRKSFKKMMAVALAAVLTVGSLAGAGVSTEAVKASAEEAATGYTGYLEFVIRGYWIYHNAWNDSSAGKSVTKIKGPNGRFVSGFDYEKNYIASNKGDTLFNDGGFVNATMSKNGTYTVEAKNLDVSKHVNAQTNDVTYWSILSISTTIPLTVKNVKCTDVKVYMNGETTPTFTLAEAPYNQEASTNGGCYDFMIFDEYDVNHKTSSALKGIDDKTSKAIEKYQKFPTKGIKIEYTLSGMSTEDFQNLKKAVAPNGVEVEGTFTKNGYKYQVTERSKDDGSKGTVTLVGTDASVKEAVVPKEVQNGANENYTVTEYDTSAFKGNKNLTKVTLPAWQDNIPESAFEGCTKLSSVTIPAAVTSIEDKAFSGCTALKSVTLGSKVKEIGAKAFSGCKALKGVKFSSKVSTIGSKAFENTALKTVKVPAKVKKIQTGTFSNCKKLTTVTLGAKTKSIAKTAFAKCVKLNKIKVAQKVKVAKTAFKGCKKKIIVSGKKANATYTKDQIKKSGYKKVK